jgi:hypothetical protein
MSKITLETPIEYEQERVVTDIVSCNAINFDNQVICPSADLASILVEFLDPEGKIARKETVQIVGSEFSKYFRQHPTITPEVIKAVQACRKVWIMILKDKGVLKDGEIVDTFPM